MGLVLLGPLRAVPAVLCVHGTPWFPCHSPALVRGLHSGAESAFVTPLVHAGARSRSIGWLTGQLTRPRAVFVMFTISPGLPAGGCIYY